MKIQLSPVQPATLANNGPKATYSSPELDGKAIHRLIMILGGTFTKAMISNIQVKLGGKIVVDGVSGSQLDAENYADTNIQEDATHLSIWAGDASASDYYGKHADDWDMSVIKGKSTGVGTPPPATVEVIITYTGATSPTLTIEADVELPKHYNTRFNKGEGNLMLCRIASTLTPSAAVTRQQNNPNIGQHLNAALKTLYLHHDSHLTSLQVLKDGVVIHDDISQTDSDSERLVYNHPTISNLYVYDPVEQHASGHAQNTLKGPINANGAVNPDPENASAYSFRLTTNAASSITAIAKLRVPWSKLT